MAAFLIESLSHNKSSFQIAVRFVEILLLSAGLVSIFLMFKGAVSTYSYDSLRKPLSSFWSWLSSPFYIGIIINIIVILIVVSSLFHRHKADNNSDIEDGGDNEDYDLHSTLSPTLSPPPPPAPPPMHQKHGKDIKRKEEAAATAAAADVAATTKSGVKKRTATASLKIQQDAEENKRVAKDNESFQEVLSDFSRLAKAKEIKKAPKTRGEVKVNPATASLIDQQDSEDTNRFKSIDEIFQAVFPEFPKLTETKEIKKVHSVDSSSHLDTVQKSTKATSEKKNQFHQTNKELENEDSEEDDTMEATWRAITGGGAKPQKKQLKKSETWPQPQTVVGVQDNKNYDIEEDIPSSAAAWKDLKKSMTFNDMVSIRCRGGLRRDSSMSLEELNQRAEDLIKNFNNEMRLQRQESEQRYLDQISRGF